MKKFLPALACLAIAFALAATGEASSVCSEPVETWGGLVRGTDEPATDVCVWRGVPYAAPPVGDLRWRVPHPHPAWDGVRDATVFGDQCMQSGLMSMADPGDGSGMSEDCLYLNIWAPKKSGSFPVMVWIHGGGYTGGSGSGYDGARLAEAGEVVVVTINYRLGIFGFLAHPALRDEEESGSTGNYGTLDQVESLYWVEENIDGFGGDPDNVTIFGESAGGLSICTLVATPTTGGLFHKAIMESGGCEFSRDLEAGYESARRSAKNIGCDFDDLVCMRNAPAEIVLKKGAAGFSGGVDSMPHHDGHVLTDTPLSMIRAGNYNEVPIMAGYNRDEFANALKLVPRLYFTPKRSYQRKLEKTFDMSENEAETLALLYPLAEFRDRPVVAYGRMFAVEAAVACPTYLALSSAAGQNSAAYLYRFDYDDQKGGKYMGAFHGLEIPFVFGNVDDGGFFGIELFEDVEASAGELSTIMQRYWVNFARTGDPNGPGLPEWPALDPSAPRLHALDVDVRSEDAAGLPERCEFWDEYSRTRGSSLDPLVKSLSGS